jgi:hypothetical protein
MVLDWLQIAITDAIKARKHMPAIKDMNHSKYVSSSLYRMNPMNLNYATWAAYNHTSLSVYRIHGVGMAGGRCLARMFLDDIQSIIPSITGQYISDPRWTQGGFQNDNNIPNAESDIDSSKTKVFNIKSKNYIFVQDSIPFQEAKYGVTGELLVSPYSVQVHVRIDSYLLNLARTQIETQIVNRLEYLIQEYDRTHLPVLRASLSSYL